MNAPIAEDLERALDNPDVTYPNHTRRRREDNLENHNTQVDPRDDFLSDLLDGQQRLITAQYEFLHNPDQMKLLTAQRDMIQCQMMVLNRLNVFG